METELGVHTFLAWNPPLKSVEVGGIKLSAGKGVVLTTKTTSSSGRSFWPTIKVSLCHSDIDSGVKRRVKLPALCYRA